MTGGAVRTTCPYCGVGCGVLAWPDGRVAGDPDHPANRGRLCVKGTALGETLGLDGRLLHPEADGRRVDWDTALDRVAAGFRTAIAEHGPDAVAFYVSGQLLTEDYYAANKLMKGFIGSANIDTNSRLCMASAVAGHRRAFGSDTVPAAYADIDEAELIVMVGANLAWCHPILHRRMAARRPGLKLVVIDPRRTAACEGADLHLALKPGSDVALYAGLLVDLVRRGRVDADYVARHTTGFADALTAADAACPDAAATAAACDLPLADVLAFFALAAEHPRMLTLFSQGVNQSSRGADKVNAILNVHLATGRIGKPGAGPFSVTGQPNAMGGREVGALANQLAGHIDFEKADEVAALRDFWQAPALAARPGLKAVELFRAMAEGRIKAVWIMATNPAVSMPDAGLVRAALARCPLVVVSDCVAETDTLALAHVRLPALGWGEKDGTVTNSERVISRQRPFLPAPGEARADWWMIAELARRLGHGTAFAWDGPAAIFREHVALTALPGRRDLDLAPLGDVDYAAMAPMRWGPERFFAEGGFFTPDRRARLVALTPSAPANLPGDGYGLVLNTGRLRDQWHTMTRTARAPRLNRHSPEPVLAVHPDDAARHGLLDGGFARIRSRWGQACLRLRHDAGQRRGEVFAPMHWSDQFAATAAINLVVNPAFDTVSGQPELKHTPVAIGPWVPRWTGFAFGLDRPPVPEADWWVRIKGDGHWRLELAGAGAPEPAWAAMTARLARRHPDAATLDFADAGTGCRRRAWIESDRLVGFAALGEDQALPGRDWLAGLFAAGPLDHAARRALLAGRPAEGRAAGPLVCACHAVPAEAIRAAITAGAGDVAAIGRATRAGTNCGSCQPEIARMIALQPVGEPA